MLEQENAIRSFLKEERRLQKGKYQLRQTVYVFKCIKCENEIEVRRSDLKKASGRCRSCADADFSADQRSARNRKGPYVALYNRFTYDRKRAGQDSTITYEEFVAFTKVSECFYCHSPVAWAICALEKNGYRYNLDRMDNDRGYSVDNCVVCCWSCNEMKGSRLSHEEMVVAMEAIIKLRTTKGGSCGA